MIYPKNQLSWAVPYLVLILYQVHGANVSIGNAITNYYPTYAEIAISQILNTLKLIKLLKSSLTFKIVPSTIYMKLERLTWSWKGLQEVGKFGWKNRYIEERFSNFLIFRHNFSTAFSSRFHLVQPTQIDVPMTLSLIHLGDLLNNYIVVKNSEIQIFENN